MKQQGTWFACALCLSVACGTNSSNNGAAQQPGGQVGAPNGTFPGSQAGAPGGAAGAIGVPIAGTGAGTAGVTGTAGTSGTAGVTGTAGASPGTAGDGAAGAPADGTDCEGFPLEGLLHSPGGDVLPNTCMPFHPTLNNPYAVRCVDAWPWYDTGFPGDEYCILPPEPGKGIQFGAHPQGQNWFAQVSQGDLSGYENLPGEWVLEPGEEEERNLSAAIDNPQPQNYYRNQVRMRSGSHHMIVWATPTAPATQSWGPGSASGLFGGSGNTSLPGAQRPDENAPKSLVKPAEDAGLYAVLPANPGVTYNFHHFNASSDTILKESWTNLWWEEDATVRVYGMNGLDVLQVATLSVSPGNSLDLHYAFNITEPIRVLTLFGHRHAWTSNFTSWVERPGGEREIVYQSFDWYDMPTYRYDSEAQNPAPNPDQRTDGARSGVLTLNPGERLHFNCHIDFTAERAEAVGAPTPTQPIRFANQAFEGEMCILFGSTAARSIGSPVPQTAPPPSFATVN